MSATIRFPYLRNLPIAPSEAAQIITILPATTLSLAAAGQANYVSVSPWKFDGETTEAPYTCVVLEFAGTIAGTIGNGTTDMIGLYGQINLVADPTNAAGRKRTLLGVLGLSMGAALPQIPIVQQAGGDFVGFSQVVNNIAVYVALSIGGVTAAVTIPEELTLTVVARPIRRRDFIG